MTTARPTRRPAPRGEPEIRAAALREQLLAELRKHNRTTVQLATMLELSREVVYRGLLSLEERGKVTSFNDRRKTVLGVIGKVWSLAEAGKAVKVPQVRDPLMWAMHGGHP